MSDGIQVIDVLVVVDEDTISSKYKPGTQDNPTVISNELVYMVVRSDKASGGQAGAELTIAAQTEDIIRWRETTLSLNGENSAILYKFVPAKAQDDKPGHDLIRKPRPILAELKTPLPNEEDPTKPTTQTVQDYFWQSTVLRAGNLTYHFWFMLVHRDGTIKGHYRWDPHIVITD